MPSKDSRRAPSKSKADGISKSLAPAASRNRKPEILAALLQCMRERGYANTSLTHLARSSGLSVSHLLYYFPSKQAALEDLCRDFVGGLRNRFDQFHEKPPSTQLEMLVDAFFPSEATTMADLALGLELIALAMRIPVIRQILRDHNKRVMTFLSQLFAEFPLREGMSAQEAARIASGLRVGLITNSAFDDALDTEQVRQMFRRSLFELANGLPPSEVSDLVSSE